MFHISFLLLFFGESEIWYTIWMSLEKEIRCIVHHVLKNPADLCRSVDELVPQHRLQAENFGAALRVDGSVLQRRGQQEDSLRSAPSIHARLFDARLRQLQTPLCVGKQGFVLHETACKQLDGQEI